MKDKFTNKWITEQSLKIVNKYEDGVLTLRGLHYQLVSVGMTNSLQHYKRVVSAMIKARREGIISYDKFSDHDRSVEGETRADKTILSDKIEGTKNAIRYWLENYRKNRWENQPVYPEVFVEKKALMGVFLPVCRRFEVAFSACKGYASLTFLNEAAQRFKEKQEQGFRPVILYFGDYDPSGEHIPVSIKENLLCDFGVSVEVMRFALNKEQVIEWKLPIAPAKKTDSRTANWNGLGQVELDAVPPEQLQELCTEAIESVFDFNLYSNLKDTESDERDEYRKELKKFIKTLD